MNKRVLFLIPNPGDGTSWWRFEQPFQKLFKTSNALDSIAPTYDYNPKKFKRNWHTLHAYDLIIMQRPYSPEAFSLIEIIKDLGIKLWVDYDDDLINVPLANPAAKVYADPANKQSLAKIIKNADLVTVSTRCLKQLYGQVNKNTQVIPNAWEDTLIPLQDEKIEKREKIVAWRGSRTHDEDLMEYLPTLSKIAQKYTDWKFMFLGKPYFQVENMMPAKNTVIIESIPLPRYFKFMNNMNVPVGIVPLKDRAFNRAKSNISWLEFTAAGAATVCPEWEEWQHQGTLRYENISQFGENIRALIEDPYMSIELRKTSLQTIREKFVLSRVNKMREEALLNLLYTP